MNRPVCAGNRHTQKAGTYFQCSQCTIPVRLLYTGVVAKPDCKWHEFGGAGLSLGEYCALVFAGVLSFEDGLRVVKARADSMAAAATLGESSAFSPPTSALLGASMCIHVAQAASL